MKIMETKVHHIKTGGTIGGCVPEYREIEILAGIFPDMIDLDKYLAQSLKIFAAYSETTVCHKDSREVTDDDRDQVVATIDQKYQEGIKKFLITHGTYTMPETGQYLMDNLPSQVKKDAQIIITGSMYPWTVLGSDAPINLGAALGLLLNSDRPMIAICMHSKLFDPRKVEKDEQNLIFRE